MWNYNRSYYNSPISSFHSLSCPSSSSFAPKWVRRSAHEPYNLRSSSRRRDLPAPNCYYNNLALGKFEARVHLERIKLLNSKNSENSTFLIKGDKILEKNYCGGKSNNTKQILKSLCTILLLLTSFIYWKDDIQWLGLNLMKKVPTAKNSVEKCVCHTVEHQKNQTKGFQDIQQNTTLLFSSLHDKPVNYSLLYNLQIMELIENEYNELGRGSEDTKKSFIEEQCEAETEPQIEKSHSNKLDTYNSDNFTLQNINDYALEFQGAKIVSIYDTEPYETMAITFLNFDFGTLLSNFLSKYYSSRGPSTILMPWRRAGDCWAFKGSHGRVQIQLSERIFISAVSIDHIPADLSPDENVKSAPKTFSIVGIDKNGDEDSSRTHLGEWEYTVGGPSLQTFPVQAKVQRSFEFIEFIIKSNHGNDLFTCVYKIKVHGYK